MLDKFLLENNEANSLLHEIISQLNPVDLPSTRQQCQKTLKKFHEIFLHFVASKEGPNWKFWSNFVKSSCFSYIALFCAIRSGNWDLRLASIKRMVPVFTAYDRPTYRKVLLQHLADCILLPAYILKDLKRGGFSVSITGRPWHSVGLDEAHEMLINKDCKQSVIHPTKEFVSRQSLYFPFRSAVLHNIKQQLRINLDGDNEHKSLELATKARNIKAVANINAMKEFIATSALLPLDNTADVTLNDPFTHKLASPAEQHDLLNFTHIGECDFKTYVQHTYLGNYSTKPTARQHRLKTFATIKPTKQLASNLQKEKK